MKKITFLILALCISYINVNANPIIKLAPITKNENIESCKLTSIFSLSSMTNTVNDIHTLKFTFSKNDCEIKFENLDKIEAGNFYKIILENVNLKDYYVNIIYSDTILTNRQKTPTLTSSPISNPQASTDTSHPAYTFFKEGTNFISLPIQFSKEQTRLSISLVPKKKEDTSNYYQLYTTQITFPAKRTYNVSGISYYVSGLHDDRYSSERPTDSTIKYTQVSNTPKIETGFATLLRFGKKVESNKWGYHFGMGVGVSISNNVRPRLLLGGGLSFGRKHMLAVDIGIITGMVDRYSSNINFNREYGIKRIPDPILKQEISCNYFGSIGYLFRF